jgi:hypothetical protein
MVQMKSNPGYSVTPCGWNPPLTNACAAFEGNRVSHTLWTPLPHVEKSAATITPPEQLAAVAAPA